MSINNIGNNAGPADHRSNTATSGSSASQGAAKAGSAPDLSRDAAQEAGKSGDTVHISSRAIDLQTLESHISQLPEVDRNRVTELRNQIAAGDYKIDAGRLADKLLAFDSKL